MRLGIYKDNKFILEVPNAIKGIGVGLSSMTQEQLISLGFKEIVEPTLTEHQIKGTPYYDDSDDKIKFNIIDLTAEEIAEKMLTNETEKYVQRQQDGVKMYAKISAEFRLAKLTGQIDNATHNAIENILRPVRDEVLAGQWITALEILETIGNSQIGQELYDRLHTELDNYIQSNYEEN